ncbi:MAG: cytochrome c family protein [Acetobacteraceae bacterium]|nr:cytochrome c family protein [Acetobacteraceae bacterium]
MGKPLTGVLTVAAVSLAIAGPAFAAGDAAAGKAVFTQNCAICHSPDAGVNKIGPSLHGVVGRKAGSLSGFEYSSAMKSFDKTWTPEELDTYLANPMQVVKGTKMIFPGLKSDTDRQNVIAYLDTLK